MKLLCSIFLALCLTSYAAAATQQLSKFNITLKKSDDTVKVQTDKDKTTFVIKSPSGISQAVIERQENNWPNTVVLKLHLKSLENLRLSNGTVTLNAEMFIKDGKPMFHLSKDKALLSEKNSWWIDIQLLSDDGIAATKLSLKNGYFKLTLPKPFFDGNPKTITVGWIDFYR